MLITLGIIGVVAALTLPGLLTRLNNIKLKSQFKEGYSIIAQALKMYNSDDERTDSRIGYLSFMNYFKGATNCGGTGDVADDSEHCIIRQSNVDGTEHVVTNKDYHYKNYAKNTNFITTNVLDDGQFYLMNNMLIMFDQNYDRPFISIDVNGKGQKPNAWGQDVFTFELQETEKAGGYELVPMGAPGTSFTDKNTYCSKTATSTMNGVACAYYAMQDNDYFNKLP